MRRAAAEVLAEALLETDQFSTLASGLAERGLHYLDVLPSSPTLLQVAQALEALLQYHPEIIPLEEFFGLPEGGRAEWGTDRLNDATGG
jgi:hypothetical protein